MVEMVEANTCFRGCCSSEGIRLHFPPSSYSLLSTIARGSESTVFEARLQGQKVVAKKPILSTSENIDKFHRELQLLCKLDHPGLAKLVAAHARPPNYMFFFEFYEMGSLAHKVHVEEWSPSVDEALVIAYDLAKALQYMHELGVVHRDVKPGNILLDSNFCPHLADFGLSSYMKDLKHVSLENWKSSGKPTGGFHKKNMVGTLIYMAPEILRKDIHTEKSDVYSFAISINELLTGVVPYTDLRAEAQAHTVLEMSYTEQQLTAAVVSEGLRPALVQSKPRLPTSLVALIQRCWDSNPVFRPSFYEITKELDDIMKDVIKTGVEKHSEVLSSSLRSQYRNGLNSLPCFQEELNWFDQGELTSKEAHDGNKIMKLWPSSLHEPLQYQPTLSWGSFAACGRREKMEDTHFLLPQMCNEKDIHVFGICDGHRGAAAAEFSARALPGFLKRSGYNSSPSKALCEAFVNTDIAFRKELTSHCNSKRVTKKDWHPGCTALTALIVRNKLFVANAGDCRAILCRSGHPFPMSKEHLASCDEERMRVMSEGMEVTWMVDTWRVGAAALQVTRSIGDDDLKPAVTAVPEIIETFLSAIDEFLVMASDGLWDVMSNEEVISIIRDTVKEATMCSKRLVTEAIERGSMDNITAIVVFLQPVSTAERVY
ncbi:protein kinase and PP2C-like domain-containing protein isoform X1 [Dendrobium catenatum]|uniref:protein-serine/threonine phosphatase n=1 Tax=Dendrobium catenatum TaxID=906689 RepID=A0A2I0VSZ6_9ASPA|nr:protein kinase and PP2C-like domain-containing protein isoform X1 [Dendrobium catenatum]PKU66529.1 Protein kinase and PP2C-like domain-containing protein [Dendrobium catenatum]